MIIKCITVPLLKDIKKLPIIDVINTYSLETCFPVMP